MHTICKIVSEVVNITSITVIV